MCLTKLGVGHRIVGAQRRYIRCLNRNVSITSLLELWKTIKHFCRVPIDLPDAAKSDYWVAKCGNTSNNRISSTQAWNCYCCGESSIILEPLNQLTIRHFCRVLIDLPDAAKKDCLHHGCENTSNNRISSTQAWNCYCCGESSIFLEPLNQLTIKHFCWLPMDLPDAAKKDYWDRGCENTSNNRIPSTQPWKCNCCGELSIILEPLNQLTIKHFCWLPMDLSDAAKKNDWDHGCENTTNNPHSVHSNFISPALMSCRYFLNHSSIWCRKTLLTYCWHARGCLCLVVARAAYRSILSHQEDW